MDIIGSGADKTIIDGQKKGSVVKFTNKNAQMHLKGLSLTNGSAKYGGGIDTNGRLAIENCRIFSNYAQYGGGVHSKGMFVMSNSVIESCKAGYGGGVYNEDCLKINNCNLKNNTAIYGGAIYNYRGDVTLNRSTFSDNIADYGGAIYNKKGKVTGQLNKGDISNNIALINGGGIYNEWAFYKGIYGGAYPKTLHNMRLHAKVTSPR